MDMQVVDVRQQHRGGVDHGLYRPRRRTPSAATSATAQPESITAPSSAVLSWGGRLASRSFIGRIFELADASITDSELI
jgi:hypothetical protein